MSDTNANVFMYAIDYTKDSEEGNSSFRERGVLTVVAGNREKADIWVQQHALTTPLKSLVIREVRSFKLDAIVTSEDTNRSPTGTSIPLASHSS